MDVCVSCTLNVLSAQGCDVKIFVLVFFPSDPRGSLPLIAALPPGGISGTAAGRPWQWQGRVPGCTGGTAGFGGAPGKHPAASCGRARAGRAGWKTEGWQQGGTGSSTGQGGGHAACAVCAAGARECGVYCAPGVCRCQGAWGALHDPLMGDLVKGDLFGMWAGYAREQASWCARALLVGLAVWPDL
eukprot:1157908-Pelagomonas_calceolata.AAC.15